MKKLFAVICIGMLAVAGRVQAEDKTYSVDNDGFVLDWLVLASIDLGDKASTHEEGAQKPMFDKEYFADQYKVTPKAGDKVRVCGKDLVWKASNNTGDTVIDLLTMCEDAGTPTENSLAMGVCYVVADEDIANVKLKIGSDDGSVWRLNDSEVIRVYAERGVEMDQNTKDGLTLKKGCNVLRFAVINGAGGFSICARFVDKDDKPVKNVKISLTPPAEK